MEGFDADFDGCSFQRFENEGKRRLMREVNDSLLRSFEFCWVSVDCAEMSESSPGVHSGLGDTTLERDPCPVWCAQKGVSPVENYISTRDRQKGTIEATYICTEGGHRLDDRNTGFL